jgi:hypothetical protein
MLSREPNELFTKFIKHFPSLKLKKRTPIAEWTRKIFDYFIKLGKDEGFITHSKNEPFEYLLDLCWIYKSEKPPLGWIETAFEIEFSGTFDANIQEFYKLVDTKAYTKVLLCKSKMDELKELLLEARQAILSNPLKFVEENYLIIAILETRKNFLVNGFVVNCLGFTVPLEGRDFPKS